MNSFFSFRSGARLQVEELRDRLWAICDTKLEENTKLHGELTRADIQKQTVVALSQGLSALVQVCFLPLCFPVAAPQNPQ